MSKFNEIKRETYFDLVKKCIDKWDPYKLLDEAPEDEYDRESEAIADNIYSDMNFKEIADVISKEFTKSFCEEWSVGDCAAPAKEIYKELKKKKTKAEFTVVNVKELNSNSKEEINFFDDEYRFLSNMYPCKVVVDGIEYQTSEAAFHAGKFKEKEYKMMLTNLEENSKNGWKDLGKKAKHLGQKSGITKQYNLPFDSEAWDNGQGQKAMLKAVRAKFKDPELAKKLLKTGDAILIEGTFWNDRTWGVALRKIKDKDDNIIGFKGSGKNQLGKILMKVRDELKTK